MNMVIKNILISGLFSLVNLFFVVMIVLVVLNLFRVNHYLIRQLQVPILELIFYAIYIIFFVVFGFLWLLFFVLLLAVVSVGVIMLVL